MRNQRHFAETSGALVGVEDLVQHFFALRGACLDDAPTLESDPDIVDQRALVRERLRRGDVTFDLHRMRRGEDLFGRNVRVAGHAVLGCRCAAVPFVAIRQPDGQVRAGAGEMQRGETFAVQPAGALLEIGVMRRPGGDRIGDIDARRGEDRIGEPSHRLVFRQARKHDLRPGRVRIGDDVPVDVEVGDLLQRRFVGHRVRLVGACHAGRIFVRQHQGIVAGDGETRCAIGIGPGHPFVEPAGCLVEARIRRVPVARECRFLVGIEGGHEPGAGHVGMLRDEPDKWQGGKRCRHHEVLVALQLEPDLHGHLRQLVELDRVDGGIDLGMNVHRLTVLSAGCRPDIRRNGGYLKAARRYAFRRTAPRKSPA